MTGCCEIVHRKNNNKKNFAYKKTPTHTSIEQSFSICLLYPMRRTNSI